MRSKSYLVCTPRPYFRAEDNEPLVNKQYPTRAAVLRCDFVWIESTLYTTEAKETKKIVVAKHGVHL